MKQFRRMLALLLCLLLSGSVLPVIAEDAPAVQTEAPAADAPAAQADDPEPDPPNADVPDADVPDADVPDADVPDTDVPDADIPDADVPDADVPDADVPDADDPDATIDFYSDLDPEADAIDCTRSAHYSPSFETGYAELLEVADGYPDANATAPELTVRSGVVYVSARSNDRLKAHFDGGSSVLSVWISDAQLRPMSEDEASSFVAANAQADRFFNNDSALPLAALDYAPVAQSIPEMQLGVTSITLGAGERCTLPVSFSDGLAHGYSCVSSKASYVKVTDGVVQGVRYGKSATITVTSEFGQTATVKVNVYRAPSSISIQPTRADLCPGEQLSATAKLNSGTASVISWSSSDEAVATVAASGEITAVAAGSADIRCKTFNGKTAVLHLTVHAAPESIALNASDLVLGVGETYALSSVAAPENFGTRSYSSSDPSIVEVDASTGRLKALAVGDAVIRVETYNGCVAQCNITVKNAPSCIRLSATSMTLGVGEKLALPEVYLGEEGEDCAGSYSIDSFTPRYAKLTADNTITGVRAGKLTLTFRSHNGCTASLSIVVKSAPRSITVQPTRADLCLGEQLSATAKLNSGAASVISWSSSDEAVATVDASGEITAVAAGSADIRCKTFNGKTAVLHLTVHAAPESIALNASDLVLGVGETYALSSVAAPENFGTRSYSSSDPSIVEVDASTGRLKALAVGDAVIRVETYNGCVAQCNITVKNAPSCIRLSATSMTLGVGEKLALPEVYLGEEGEDCAGSYSIDSFTPRYAKLTADNTITGVRAGKLTLTFRSHNGCTASLSVVVKSAPRSIKLSPTKACLGIGEALQLTATLNSGAVGGMQFTSSDESVATVDASGRVLAVGRGTATITVCTYNNRKASCVIEVLDAPTDVCMSAPQLAIGVGESYTMAAILSEGSAGKCSFTSDDPTIASIDASSGKITALAVGSTTLRVETYNGLTAECALSVHSAPTGVAFQESAVTLAVGDSYQLLPPQILGDDSASATLKYSSSSARLKVSATGLLTATSTGTVRITVATYHGKKASITVKIVAAPKAIAFEQDALYLCVGESHAPTLVVTPANINYSMRSSDPAVAAIADDGRTIQALSAGTATITATSYNGKTATLTLTVPPLPDSLDIAPSQLTLGSGDSMALKAVMPEGQDSTLIWTSTDPEVASVDAIGLVHAVAPGAATITVRSYNDLESSCAVTVLMAPTRVELVPNRAMRSIDEDSVQLALRFGAEGEGGRCAFRSSDESVATVDANGLVTLRGVGSAKIHVETYNGHKAVCDLIVGETPSQMFFPQESYAVALNDTVRLDAAFDHGCESYSLRVTDARVASAQGDEVTGLALGSTSLTAVSYSGLTAECALNVVPEPSGIELDQTELSVVLGSSVPCVLTARALPDGVGSIRYTSSDPTIATVDAVSGVITPVAMGSCTITAETYNGHSASCTLEVRGLLSGVKIGIDPGHQGKADYSRETISPTSSSTKAKVSSGTGGRVTHIPEHVVNLQIGLKLRDALEALGAEVYMTRTTADVNISNQQRAKMMNELGVDLVLRIHCNGGSSSRYGMMIYVRQTGACKDESAAAAQLILDAMQQETGAKSHGVKYSDTYTGLNWSTVPSMLMELGYLTNAREDRLLNSPEYQDKLVTGMINGICTYMGRPTPAQLAQQSF